MDDLGLTIKSDTGAEIPPRTGILTLSGEMWRLRSLCKELDDLIGVTKDTYGDSLRVHLTINYKNGETRIKRDVQ